MTFNEWLVELTRLVARWMVRPILNVLLRAIENFERDVMYWEQADLIA